MTVVVVATFRPEPASREAALEALKACVAQVHATEAGCELFSLNEGRDRLVMIEKWESMEALRAHGAGQAFKSLTDELVGKLLDEPDVQVLRPHPAGSASLGLV